MAAEPVILKTDVHCLRCARRIRDFVRTMHGVEAVWASVDTGRVVVAGASLDASLLRRRIQARTRKPVAVLSDGGGAADAEEQQPAAQMLHMGPTYGYGYGYGGGWPAAAPPLQSYVPGGGGNNNALPYYGYGYGYGGGGGAMVVADGGASAACYRDDDGPSGCCTMQ